MSIPTPQRETGLSAAEFLAAACAYHANGWPVLPIGRVTKPGKPAGKAPWFCGLTGFDGVDAHPDEFDTWPTRVASRIARHGGVLNLGVRLPPGVIGFDIDAYDGKRGLETLAEREAEWGPLPPTWRITARPYESGSGIRLFRVDPNTWRWPGDFEADDGSDGHFEVIDRHHRLIAVPPSVHHTGNRYRLYDPDGIPVVPPILPPINVIGMLP